MIFQFQRSFGEDTQMILCPESPMFNVPEAKPATEPYLEKVRQAGREYRQNGRFTEETKQALAIPMIPKDEYREICSR